DLGRLLLVGSNANLGHAGPEVGINIGDDAAVDHALADALGKLGDRVPVGALDCKVNRIAAGRGEDLRAEVQYDRSHSRHAAGVLVLRRSEERRVGKEWKVCV